jgi:hypothetical protein
MNLNQAAGSMVARVGVRKSQRLCRDNKLLAIQFLSDVSHNGGWLWFGDSRRYAFSKDTLGLLVPSRRGHKFGHVQNRAPQS